MVCDVHRKEYLYYENCKRGRRKNEILDVASDLFVTKGYDSTSMNVNSKIKQEAIKQMHKPQNVLMHKKMQVCLLEGIVPILTDLILEGIEEGIFKTKFPKEAVEMIMVYVTVIFDGEIEQSREEQERRVQGFIYNIERLMGVNEGSMVSCVIKIFKEKAKEGI